MKEIQVAAHTLKGMLASLSFCKASVCALHIERMAAQGVQNGLLEETARLERAAELAERYLETVCQEVIR